LRRACDALAVNATNQKSRLLVPVI